jgi:hypothetical protein
VVTPGGAFGALGVTRTARHARRNIVWQTVLVVFQGHGQAVGDEGGQGSGALGWVGPGTVQVVSWDGTGGLAEDSQQAAAALAVGTGVALGGRPDRGRSLSGAAPSAGGGDWAVGAVRAGGGADQGAQFHDGD